MLRIIGASFARLAASRAAAPTRALATSAGRLLFAADKPARGAAASGGAKDKPKPKPKAKAKPKTTTKAKAKKALAKSGRKPKQTKQAKQPTKTEQIEAKLNSKRALLKAPKQPPSAYALFMKTFSASFPAGEGQRAGIAERARACAAKWQQLGEAEKQRVRDEAEKQRAAYEATAREWWRTVDPSLVALENRRRRRQAGTGKAVLLRNPFAPKRPINAFMTFAQEHVRQNMPAAAGAPREAMCALTREAGAKWRALSEAERARYTKAAEAAKARYAQDVAAYRSGRAAAAQ